MLLKFKTHQHLLLNKGEYDITSKYSQKMIYPVFTRKLQAFLLILMHCIAMMMVLMGTTKSTVIDQLYK